VSNAVLCINAAKLIGIDESNIISGIEKTLWKCRFENIEGRLIIDGAHNYQGICAFRESLDLYVPKCKRVIVLGMLNDKDFTSSAKVLSNIEGKFIVTDVPSARQTSGMSVYNEILKSIPGAVYESDYKMAINLALKQAGNEGIVCVIGSLYLAGAVRTYVKGKL